MKKIVVIGMVILAVGAAFWFRSAEQAADPSLVYRLKWLFNASVAGDIYADAGGFFKRAGLNVTVKEGSPEKNAINELELGHAHFGVASADQVIRALEKGAKIVVIAQIFQVNPMQWIYRADQGEIRTPAGLSGRRVGITFGGNDETIMKTLLASAGMDDSVQDLVGVRFDFTPFLKGQVDVWPVYRNTQGVILEEKLAREGEGVLFFNPADHGVAFVANSVVTTRKMLQKRPETVKRFIAALADAWEAAMDPRNEAAVVAAIKARDKGTQGPVRVRQLRATRPLVKPAPAFPVGKLDIRAWQQTLGVMKRLKQVGDRTEIGESLIPGLVPGQ